MIEQLSIFDLMEPCESRFTAECRNGSGFEGGRVRIYCASCNLGYKDFAGYLKEEYGIGGHSMTFPDGERGFADYHGNGVELWQFKSNWKERHTWLEMAKEIKRLIFADDYLNEKDKAELQEVLIRFGGQAPLPIPRCGWEAIK